MSATFEPRDTQEMIEDLLNKGLITTPEAMELANYGVGSIAAVYADLTSRASEEEEVPAWDAERVRAALGELLREGLDGAAAPDADALLDAVREVQTYSEAAILTLDEGLVLRLDTGQDVFLRVQVR